jgi:hypothetical protein
MFDMHVVNYMRQMYSCATCSKEYTVYETIYTFAIRMQHSTSITSQTKICAIFLKIKCIIEKKEQEKVEDPWKSLLKETYLYKP